MIQRNYHFANIKKYIIDFIIKYKNCQKNKHNIIKNISNNIIIKKLIKLWQSVIINFIIKLLKFKNPVIKIEYNNIWVIVNCFIK